MSFAAGAAIFNRCNKPAAIEEFTEHLRVHPTDTKALRWRAKAYGIIGQRGQAEADLTKAISTSSGLPNLLAHADKLLLFGFIEEFGKLARKLIDEHPNSWEGWEKLGDYQMTLGDKEEAMKSYRTALDVAHEEGETKDPGICWIHRRLGDIWLERGENEIAANYYNDAIESSPTHTASYIGLVFANLYDANFNEAKKNFEIANGLNPELVKSQFETNSFDEYIGILAKKKGKRNRSSAAVKQQASGESDASTTNISTGGNGNGTDGSDDDASEKSTLRNVASSGDVSAIWKQMQRESPNIKLYKGHKYVQSKCGKYWYSKDTAGHAGAAFKRYVDTGRTLRFQDSLDRYMKPMIGKHESRKGTVIFKNQMDGVRGK